MKWLERIPEEHREPVAVLLVSISVFIWGAILTLFLAGDMAETYTSEAKLLVKESPKEALSFGADQTMQKVNGRGNEYLQVQLAILNSTDVRERVSKRLLEDSAVPDLVPESPEERTSGAVLASGPSSALNSLMGRLQSRFKAENGRNSPLISLKATWHSKAGAQQLLQHFIDAFKETRRDFYSMESTVKASVLAVAPSTRALTRALLLDVGPRAKLIWATHPIVGPRCLVVFRVIAEGMPSLFGTQIRISHELPNISHEFLPGCRRERFVEPPPVSWEPIFRGNGLHFFA